jgi:hypothetical protein
MDSATEPIDSDPDAFKAAAALPAPEGGKLITPRPYKEYVPPAPAPASATAPASAPSSSIKREYYYYPYVYDTYRRDSYLRPSSTLYNYQNINDDLTLQEKVTDYFLEKTIEWIKYDNSFRKCKKYLRSLEGINGEDIIYKLLKLFVRKGNTNWYDLKLQKKLVKDFIKHKLSNL